MEQPKKRLLIVISYSFSIRYIYRSGLLHMLKEFCEPVICLTWKQEDLVNELKADGFEVHLSPVNEKDAVYAGVRQKIDIWFKYFALKSKSKKIQASYLNSFTIFKKRLIHSSREAFNRLKLYMPGVIKKLHAEEASLLHSHTNFNALSAFVDMLSVDAVFTVTPFHRQEDILLRACEEKGKKMLTAILSFDNITKRGWMPVKYDIYTVWNKYNKAELKRIYPAVKTENIHITGAPQFDFYFNHGYLPAEDEWRRATGLTGIPQSRKIILYSGGPKALFPHEPDYLKDINDAISSGAIKGKPIVLFRCHPIDTQERWKAYIGQSDNIIYDNSWTGEKNLGEANITAADIKKLCATLAYTDVHINLCSTMTVDGSAYNKPQIGPAYYKNNPEISRRLEKMYWQEHFVPIMQTGKLMLARSRDELINYINLALDGVTTDNRAIVENIITYTDGKSTERVANVLQQSLSILN